MNSNEDKLFIAVVILVLTTIVRETFAFFRERREYKRWQASNFKDQLEVDYFHKNTRISRKEIKNSLNTNNEIDLENKDIYSLCLALQKLGAQTFLGAIPLNSLLFLNGPQIASDWLLVNDHVNHIRSQEQLTSIDIPFQRRHAEWLSILTFMWVINQRKYKYSISYYEDILELIKCYGDKYEILQREKLLFLSDVSHATYKLRWERYLIRVRFRFLNLLKFIGEIKKYEAPE